MAMALTCLSQEETLVLRFKMGKGLEISLMQAKFGEQDPELESHEIIKF